MTVEDVRKILRDECERCGGQAHWATKHSVSPAYVSDTLNSRREPGPALLYALRVVKAVTYERLP